MATHRKHGLAVMAAIILAVVSAEATSHVRIVRLSYQDGNVQMSRGTGQGLERAILNSPVVEGSSVVTGSDGLAEVEFENNSTVRLGGATDVNFRQLLMNDAGEKVNEVELVRGTIYFDTRSSKDNVYRVIASDRTFIVQRNSQVRFIMNGDQVEVSVTNGEAQLQNNAELVKIKKNDTLTLDATIPAGYVLAKGVDSLPLDRWNNERAAYQSVYSYNNTGYGSSSMAGFGYQDLAYYGGFMNVPGYGLAWQPYGAAQLDGMEPLHRRSVGVHSRIWLCVGFSLSLGLVTVPLWRMGIFTQHRLVLGSRQFDGQWRSCYQLAGDSPCGEGTGGICCSRSTCDASRRIWLVGYGGSD